MFSGIIEQIGRINRLERYGKGLRLEIQSALLVSVDAGVGKRDREQVGLGDSIAINGVCLTVEEIIHPDAFVVVCGQETLNSTMLGMIKVGTKVHLERALQVGSRLDGHLVQGHVDGVGHVESIVRQQESIVIWIEAPSDLMRYIATKGSIALNGVSLTVNEIHGSTFRVNVVPYTADETLIPHMKAGAPINIEVDLLARYIERLIGVKDVGGERLEELGLTNPYTSR